MRLFSTAVVLGLLVSACGDSGTSAGGNGGNAATGGNPATGGDSSSGAGPTTGGAGGVGGEGASGGSGGAADPGVKGSAGKGPLVGGSSVLIATLDGAGEPTGTIFSTVTSDSLGNFSVPVNAGGPARIEATGFFFNELADGLSSAPITLRALVEVDGTTAQTINVNTLTHLTLKRAFALWQGGASLADARAQAYEELVVGFELGAPGFDPGADAADASLVDGDTDAGAFLLAVSAVGLDIAKVNAGSGAVEPELAQWLDAISTDLEDDGLLTETHRAQIAEAEGRLDANAILQNLIDYVDDAGSSAVVPNINRALDQDGDDVSNLDDCLPLDPLRWPGNADLDLDGHDAAPCGGDCDDDAFAINPDAADDWDVPQHLDTNCDGIDGEDADGDGIASMDTYGADCDDTDPAIGAPWRAAGVSADFLAIDGAGVQYALDSANLLMSNEGGSWAAVASQPPAGAYLNMLAEADGTLHLIALGSHVTNATGVWTTGPAPATPNFGFDRAAVDENGVMHYARPDVGSNPPRLFYVHDAGGVLTTTNPLAPVSQFAGIGSVVGLDVDATSAIICYRDSGSIARCMRPTGELLSATASSFESLNPNCDGVAVWNDGTVFMTYFTQLYIAGVTGPGNLASYQTIPGSNFPNCAVATDGSSVHVVYSGVPDARIHSGLPYGSVRIGPLGQSPSGCKVAAGGGEVALRCGSQVLERDPACVLP